MMMTLIILLSLLNRDVSFIQLATIPRAKKNVMNPSKI